MRILRIILLTAAVTAGAAARPADHFIARRHTADGKNIPFRLFIPHTYTPGVQYPVMLTLHGGGGNGTDNWYHITYGANVAEAWADTIRQLAHPSFVVSPQIPSGASWGDYAAWNADLLDSLMREFSIDPARQYVCGISLGGFGTVDIVGKFPGRFAAAVPMSSGGGVVTGRTNAVTPHWVFHSGDDTVVPVAISRDYVAGMEEAMAAIGESVTYTRCGGPGCNSPLSNTVLNSLILKEGQKHFYTEFSTAGHACQGQAFAIAPLFTWVYAQRIDGTLPGNPTNLRAAAGYTSLELVWDAPAAAVDGDTATWYWLYRDGVSLGRVYGTSFTDDGLQQGRTYRYEVYAADFMRNRSTAAASADIATGIDANPPEIDAVYTYAEDEIEVVFTKPMDTGKLGSAGSYALSGGASVTAAAAQADGRSAVLTTAGLVAGTECILDCSGMADAGGTAAAAGTEQAFTAVNSFNDDFEDGNFTSWNPPNNAFWTVTADSGDNALYLQSREQAPPLRTGRTYRTVTVDCDVRAYSGSTGRNAGVVFGYAGPDDYYYANMGGSDADGINGIFRVVDGVPAKIGSASGPLLPNRDQYHRMRVFASAVTGSVRVYVDDSSVPKMAAVDAALVPGDVGLFSIERRAYFDNVEVRRVRTDGFLTVAPAARNRKQGAEIVITPCPAAGITEFAFTVPVRRFSIRTLDGTEICRTAGNGTSILWNAGTGEGGVLLYEAETGAGVVRGRFMRR